MKSHNDTEETKRVVYVKPEFKDLGPLMSTYGANCAPSGGTADPDCLNGTFAGSGDCGDGTTAAY